MLHRFSKLALLATLLSAALTHAQDQPFQTDVYTSGKDGYHTYRIPSLLVTKAGTLLAFAEGRKDGAGDHGNLDLIVKRSMAKRPSLFHRLNQLEKATAHLTRGWGDHYILVLKRNSVMT
jgi:Neuraminidase (sialidase)